MLALSWSILPIWLGCCSPDALRLVPEASCHLCLWTTFCRLTSGDQPAHVNAWAAAAPHRVPQQLFVLSDLSSIVGR